MDDVKPILFDLDASLMSLQTGISRVSWSKTQQHERCPGNWFVENHALLLDRTHHIDDSLHAIPGTLIQRVWEGLVNDRVYRRPGLGARPAHAAWAGRQIEALFHCIARPLEEQHRIPKDRLRRYFQSPEGKAEFDERAAESGLDAALFTGNQPKFVDFERLFLPHGSRTALLAKLAGTFGPALEALDAAGLDLDGLLAEAFVTGTDGTNELAGGIDFLWSRRRSDRGIFDSLELLDEGYVLLDGKFTMGPTVEEGQLAFYAEILALSHGVRPSKVGFLCYSSGELKLLDFEPSLLARIRERVDSYRSGTEAVRAGLERLRKDQGEGNAALGIERISGLSFKPGKFACRFCGISERCGSAVAARTSRRKPSVPRSEGR